MTVRILQGDCREVLRTLPDESVHCVVTSPPYFGLRSYLPEGHPDKSKEIGLELTPDAFVAGLVEVFREAHRVLRKDGTLWLNLGDSYANDGKWGGYTGGKHTSWLHGGETRIGREKRRTGLKPKDLIGIPWRVAFALQADGWWLRQDIIWAKPNPMPESIEDRCTKAHEYLFLLSKSERYFFDFEAIAEGAVFGPGTGVGPDYAPPGGGPRHLGLKPKKRGVPPRHAPYASCDQSGLDAVGRGRRNKRSVWTVPTSPFPDAHYATFPPALIVDCIKAGCPAGGTVLDPFGGAGTTGLVAQRLGREAILLELDEASVAMAERRIAADRAGPVERDRIRHGHKPADHGPLFADPTLTAAE
ncbi:DNA-methyltransferase [Methylobacterium brachiatum]|uniref:DNA-methyltransferase n=1 Tax=Methylobacterium brachiatum TaxID=269660 RepID=UPI0024470F4F|nr:site-specific DNA-methyltransferase [Methylobacterium brachiatum]MDH2313384.1 site-specific DNA-methyltransferase [Methylobacterium brachiatum]